MPRRFSQFRSCSLFNAFCFAAYHSSYRLFFALLLWVSDFLERKNFMTMGGQLPFDIPALKSLAAEGVF